MLLHKPSDAEIRQLITAQSKLPFSYFEVGASRNSSAPAGYHINHYRGRLGAGRKVFDNAVAALRAWEMYNVGWTKLCWPDTPVREGETVAVLARHLGFWSLNACRIIYTIEEAGRPNRSGFAFGTLPCHVEEGEERFTVEWDGDSDEVWYELFAFARPSFMLAKIGYPFARAIQKRFAADSFDAMRRALDRRETP